MISSLRGIDPNRKINKDIVLSFFFRGAGLLFSLATATKYLGFFSTSDALGIWFSLISIANWMLSLDFGVGNGLRNRLTEMIAVDSDDDSIRDVVAAGIVSSLLISLTLALVGFVVIAWVDWSKFFRVGEHLSASGFNVRGAVLIVYSGTLLQLVLRTTTSILYALQKPTANSLLSFMTSVLLFTGTTLIRPSSDASALRMASIVQVTAMIAPLIVATVFVYCCSSANIIPRFSSKSWRRVREVSSLGVHFFYVQTAYMAVVASNEMFLNHLYGNKAVVEYQFQFRIFSLVATAFTIIATPFWSYFTRVYTQKNYHGFVTALRKVLVLALFASVGTVLLAFVVPIVHPVFADGKLRAPSSVELVSMTCTTLATIWVAALSTITNGLGYLRAQAIGFSVGIILKTILILLARNLNALGWSAAPLATGLCFLPYFTLELRVLKRVTREVI